MASAVDSRKVSIVLDIENIFYAALKDPDLLSKKPTLVLRASVVAVERIAMELGKVYYRFGALSLPKLNRLAGEGGFAESSRMIERSFRNVQILVDLGYEIYLVTEKPDAADAALCRTARAISGEVDVVLLGTADKGEHFSSLVEDLLEQGKEVRTLSFESAPVKVRRKKIPHHRIASDIRKLLEGKEPQVRFVEKVDKIMEGAAAEESWDKKLRKSVVAYTEDEIEKADFTHLRWIHHAVEALQEYCYGRRAFSFGELLRALQQRRDNWPQPQPQERELKVLLSELVGKTDLFSQTSMYIYNLQSRILQKVEKR